MCLMIQFHLHLLAIVIPFFLHIEGKPSDLNASSSSHTIQFENYERVHHDSESRIDQDEIFPEYDLTTNFDSNFEFEDDDDWTNLERACRPMTIPKDDEILGHHYSPPFDENDDSSSLPLSCALSDLLQADDTTDWSNEDVERIQHLLGDVPSDLDHLSLPESHSQHRPITTQERQGGRKNPRSSASEYDPIVLTSDGITTYWQSLHSSHHIKSHLITKYCSLACVRGHPLDRNLAAKRLRVRCSEQIAKDLLSGNVIKEQHAKRAIDCQPQRILTFLSPAEIYLTCKILVDRYKIAPWFAPQMVNRGAQLLSLPKRRYFASIETKSSAVLSALTREIYKTFEMRKIKVYREDATPNVVAEWEMTQDDVHQVEGTSSDTFWMSLSELEQNDLIQKYTLLGRVDCESARYIL